MQAWVWVLGPGLGLGSFTDLCGVYPAPRRGKGENLNGENLNWRKPEFWGRVWRKPELALYAPAPHSAGVAAHPCDTDG